MDVKDWSVKISLLVLPLDWREISDTLSNRDGCVDMSADPIDTATS